MLKGFRNFLMQGDLIVVAVGLVVALALSTLIQAFSTDIVTPLVNAAAGSPGRQLGWVVHGQRIDLGGFIGALVYFVIFVAVIYLLLVVPYRRYMARRGSPVFGPAAATKVCHSCLSGGIPLAASKCRYCGDDLALDP